MENNKNNLINRREALRRTAMVMGTALSATTIAGVMQGCKADPELAWTPVFFDESQARFISLMAGTIIPRTGTPGAREVGVPGFIEDMVSKVYNEEEQKEFLAGLEACRSWCLSAGGDEFIYLSEDKQLELVESLDEAMKEAMSGGRTAERPTNEADQPVDDEPAAEGNKHSTEAVDFFGTMKQLTVAGFFTSEAGATQVLQYKAIPVEYHGCISLEEAGGKTWAT